LNSTTVQPGWGLPPLRLALLPTSMHRHGLYGMKYEIIMAGRNVR